LQSVPDAVVLWIQICVISRKSGQMNSAVSCSHVQTVYVTCACTALPCRNA